MTRNIWLRLGRVSNLPTVWSNVLAASALTQVPVRWQLIAALGLGMSALYVGGMYLNDAFDREIDARERPGRPIPSGAVSARTVFTIGFLLLALGVAISTLGTFYFGAANVVNVGASSLALAGLILLYDAYHKQNPLSPLLMALCRVFVYLTSALAVSGTVAAPLWTASLGLLCHLIGLTYTAKHEAGPKLQRLWPLALLAVTPVWGAIMAAEPLAAAVDVGLVLWLLFSLSWLFRSAGRSIPGSVVRLIAGISLVDALFAALSGAPLLALACVLCCGLTRLLQRMIPGT
jgi:UbiA prenyltransferase family